jgi:hypothetical protein
MKHAPCNFKIYQLKKLKNYSNRKKEIKLFEKYYTIDDAN